MSPPPAAVVELRDATVGYGDRPVLSGVDFRLDRGEVVAVLGPNGAGKSTLVRGILGLAQVTSGRLDLFGTPAAHVTQRSRLGYVPQRHPVAAGVPATVREIVATGRLGRTRWLRPSSRADRQAVQQAIETVGLTGRERDPVGTLSGGQQRRVLIARALAGEPDVLVMDEPMAGVDAAHQDALAATLRRLAHDGTTMLIVTHELGPLDPLLSRVVWVREGSIVYDGPADVVRREFVGDPDPHPVAAPARSYAWPS